MEESLSIRSLLKDEYGDKWYPKSVEEFTTMLRIPAVSEYNSYATSKNIAYNLQYLEYLQKQLDELSLSDVLAKMIRKNYIVVAMGIIEALFAYLLRSTGNWKTSEWKLIQKNNIDNQKATIIQGKEIKVKTELFEKVESYETEMQFDAIIDKIRSTKLITFKSDEAFNVLKKYKNLRNKVHLHISQYSTDYGLFDETKEISMKHILLSILSKNIICAHPSKIDEVYYFLK